MKRNKIAIIIILAIIAGLHFAFLYAFYVHREEGIQNPPAPAIIPQPPEPTVIAPPEKKKSNAPGYKKKTAALPSSPSPGLTDGTSVDAPSKRIAAAEAAAQADPDMNPDAGTAPVPAPERVVSAAAPVSRNLDYSKAARGTLKAVPESKFVKSGILYDPATNRVLWSTDPEARVPIASMTKMMTLLVALDMLSSRKDVSLDSSVTVSNTAVLVAPTHLGIHPGQQIPLEELLKSMIIKSANDSAQMVAEFLGSGSAENFVAIMNQKAAQLGMKSSHFYNPHGLPGKSARSDNVSTCEDLILLAQRLLQYRQAATWVSTRMAKIGGFPQPVEVVNHNRLLSSQACPGVNGVKTGFTQRAGFCITVNCVRGPNRLIAVFTGVPSSKVRDAVASKMLNWGFKRKAVLDTRKF